MGVNVVGGGSGLRLGRPPVSASRPESTLLAEDAVSATTPCPLRIHGRHATFYARTADPARAAHTHPRLLAAVIRGARAMWSPRPSPPRSSAGETGWGLR